VWSSSGEAAVLFWLLGIFGAIAWAVGVVIMALTDDMRQTSDRVAQLYGYTVCLISVVVFLISITSLVNSAFKLTDPLHGNVDTLNLGSFEAYKASYASVDQRRPPPDAELRARYEALRSDRIASVTRDAVQAIVVSVVMLIVAVVLFAFHWMWLRRRASLNAAAR